jgi:L-threonylcarbamoyladenylate synthase
MEIISNPTQVGIEKAAKALIDGQLVAFPTETVYGLGADASNPTSVARIYEVKGRPTGHPLIVHISSSSQIDKWALNVPEYAINLTRNFWPGPMTLILKRSQIAKDFITGGQDLVGLRVPSQQIALKLIQEFERLGGLGIAAPSANRFGAVSPTSIDAVQDELGSFLSGKDILLDGGTSEVGIESTIIDCSGRQPVIIRPGAITSEMLNELFGQKFSTSHHKKNLRASGILKSHYSPKADVIPNKNPQSGDGMIALKCIPTPTGVIRLAEPSDIKEFASCLYAALRLGDKLKIKKIIVLEPPGNGFAEAIRDRVSKASFKSNKNNV